MSPWIVATIVGGLVVGALVIVVYVLAGTEESELMDEYREDD